MSYINAKMLQPIKPASLMKEIEEEQMWRDIRKLAKTSPALQEALDRVMSIYILTNPSRG